MHGMKMRCSGGCK